MEIDGLNFEETGGSVEYFKAKELPVDGKWLVGKYVGAIESKFGNFSYKFKKKSGGFAIVNHCGSLAHSMKSIEVGQWVALSYAGEGQLEKGAFAGKKFHKVNVQISDDVVKTNDEIADEIPF